MRRPTRKEVARQVRIWRAMQLFPRYDRARVVIAFHVPESASARRLAKRHSTEETQ